MSRTGRIKDAGGTEGVSPEAWMETYRLLTGSDAGSLVPGDLETLADVTWLLCRFDESTAARQRAYAGYLEGHMDGPAARSAWRLFWEHLYSGEMAVALGWLRRARRHLAGIPEAAEHGLVTLADSELALNRGSLDEAVTWALRAVEIGVRHDSHGVVALGLTLHGRALIAQGRLDEGCSSLDEAMALVLSGQLDAYFSGAVYCAVIAECRDVADMRRASEWTDAARACARRCLPLRPSTGSAVSTAGRCWVFAASGRRRRARSALPPRSSQQSSRRRGARPTTHSARSVCGVATLPAPRSLSAAHMNWGAIHSPDLR